MGRKLDTASRVNRPYVRRQRQTGVKAASTLTSAAGLTARPTVEQLERRQMLFALAVTANDVDPNTGIGTVRRFFSYAIPYLNTSIVVQQPQPPTAINEPFGDEPFGPVGSGQFFLASGIQSRNNIAPPADFAIHSQTDNQQEQNRWLRVKEDQTGEFFTFEFYQPPDTHLAPVAARTASITITGDGIGDNTGLLTDNVRVDLLAGADRHVIASFTGAALRALVQAGTGNPVLGTGTFVFNAPANEPGFNAIQFTMTSPPGAGVNPAFRVTNVSYTLPSTPFEGIIESRIFGAEAVLSGPVGATATFLDLYGRDMHGDMRVGKENGQELADIDPDGDGVPNFNDGIGQIRFTGTDSRTAFTLWGGNVVAADTAPAGADSFDGRFAFTVSDTTGLFDAFESAGSAYAYDVNNNQVRFAGLPPGPGSVIVGSPYIRDNTSGTTYNPGGAARGVANPVTTGFTNANQGLFIDDGAPIGSIYLFGILNGSSHFTNFVDRIYVGYMVGSINVEGDLGSLIVGTDAGQWVPDPGFTFTNPNQRLDANNKTGGQLTVGRTVGEISIAGRSLLDVTVIGDLNNPQTHPARDVFTYYEKEYIAGINPTGAQPIDVVRALINNTNYVTRQPGDLFRNFDQALVYGTQLYRNDTLMGAEWVGSISSGVRIKGELSGRDPLNAEDTDDIYAFAVDGTQDISIEGTNDTTGTAPYFRIVDQDGRTLAAPQNAGSQGRFQTTQLKFHPNNGPGIYYLVVTDPNGGTETGFANTSYTVTITGMATATLGAYHTAGGSGFTDINSGQGNSIVVLSGNIGQLRIGTGMSDGQGGEVDPLATYNTTQTADDSMDFQGGTFTTPGTLYGIVEGSDIGNPGGPNGSPIDIRVGKDFGTLFTGMSLVVGGGPRNGDLNLFRLTVGGSIASMDIRGGIGMDQDATDPLAPVGGSIVITTGTAGGRGDIGFIRVGYHVAGNEVSINTSPGSIIGALLVSQDAYNDQSDPFHRYGIYRSGPGQFGLPVTTGPGSDVRFFDAPKIDLVNGRDIQTPLIVDTPAEFTDDAGSHVTITVNGGTGGTVRVLPVDGSQGVAIGSITVDLTGGATLHIHGTNASGNGIVSIGHIIVTASDAGSAIEIDGQVQVDVYRIESGSALDHITNTTTNGDIVAVDVASLNTINVSGDLGMTQTPAWGPSLIGPQLGLAVGLSGVVGGPIGVPATAGALVSLRFGGGVYRPVTDDNFTGLTAFLDDIGSPLGGQLNGLVVRTGGLTDAQVKGSVVDLILQDAAGTLASLVVNSDGTTPLGGFDGIRGNIFAFNIVQIDIGDGLMGPGTGPIATADIVAINDIGDIHSSKSSGALFSGIINAANSTVDSVTNPDQIDGIGAVTARNATMMDARIASETLDGFWASFNYDDEDEPLGNIGNVQLTSTTFFRSVLRGQALNNFTISGANTYFDASEIHMTGNIGVIDVQAVRNSTLNGDRSELHDNFIQGARDTNRISVIGDMQDLSINLTGSVTGSITAFNMTRVNIAVDNQLASLVATNDIRASSIIVGAAPSIRAGRNLQSDIINVSGPLTVQAGNQIANTDIAVTGPDGRIDSVTARTLISGSISASGPIGTVSVTAGDLAATITTTTDRGNVGSLTATGNLDVVTDISGSVTSMTAGGNIGSPDTNRVILVRGDLTTASAVNGQLYSDLRVAGAITGSVTIGGAVAKPGNDQVGTGSIIAFGRIASVVVNGDLNGSILSYSGGINSIAVNNGSVRTNATIAAYDGSIASLVITNGNLYGNVHADYDITSLRVVGLADGVFGDIGVNPNESGQVSYDSKRNQLPPGVAAFSTLQGPTISAGQNIVSIQVPNGSVYETQFIAGRAIKNINIYGTVTNDSLTPGQGSLFAAGDSIDVVTIGGGVGSTAFIAGLVSLGADGRAGGTGVNADTVKSGNINTITINNGMSDSTFSAGISAGADGVYNTADDLSVFGLSKINTLALSGTLTNVSAFGDQLGSSVTGNSHLTKGGTNLPSTNSRIDTGGAAGVQFSGTRTFTGINGADITITFSGAGQAFFNAANATLTLRNTNSTTNLSIASSTGTIRDFDVVTNDDSSLGTVKFQTAVTGNSDFVVDGGVTSLTYGDFSGTGTVAVGGDMTSATFASLTGGFFSARTVQTLRINGQFGNSNSTVVNEARIDLLSGGSISISGGADAVISVVRDAASLNISGPVDRAAFRFGNSLATFTAPNLSRSYLSAGDTLGSVTIGGDVLQSTISAGADLGADGQPGGTGINADTVSSGIINSVTVAGNFRESSLSAGYLRGPDGFFGTADDTVAAGRSTIGPVTIGGTQVGSSHSSESFRIASSGSLGTVRIGGQTLQGAAGNFSTETPLLAPLPIQVKDIQVTVQSRVSTANIIFNQPMDSTTIARALSVSEVRGSGDVLVRLVDGIDYTVSYNSSTNTEQVTFSEAVTSRNLPVVPGKPGPGIYRFELDPNILRAKLTGVSLDGNGDGFATTGDHYAGITIVGDAGDKVTSETDFIGPNNSYRVDMYAPVNLDLVMSDPFHSDGLAQPNKPFTIRGFIGDHPDNDNNYFRFAGDVDLYKVTLQAGQILNLGALQGSAIRAGVSLFDPNGVQIQPAGANASVVVLPSTPAGPNDLTFATSYLVEVTGTYVISVGNAQDINTPGAVPNPNPPPGGLGDYSFTVNIFDDANSGFSGTTEASSGSLVANAPAPIAFAGPDGVFGTSDDPTTVVSGNFSFTLNKGPDGLPNTADDLVTGTDGNGIVSTRDGNGRMVNTINSSIGPAGHTGAPTDIFSDVDIYHLNGRNPIAPGTRLTITVKLADLGADLGSASPTSGTDNRGSVQFGIFDTSNSIAMDDANLVFSPTEFTPTGGKPNTVIADNGTNRYGYDANGDFYISFVAPDRQGSPGSSGTFALYLQGTINTDYQIQVTNDGTTGTLATHRQNVLIETNGGTINWLQAGGVTTNLGTFTPQTLGFTGTIAGQDVQTYILTNLVAALNSLFQSTTANGTGLDVHFSTNPSDFEFQPFSTVFLTSSPDPVAPLFDPFSAFNFTRLSQQFFNTQPYGASQHSDPFNTDLEDEAVVFVPSFALQGLTPGQSDTDLFVQSLTAAIGRRAGELMGLRVSQPYAANSNTFDPFAANSVDNQPGPGRAYSIVNQGRVLSNPFDSVNRTDFFLGHQNARSLLEKVLNQL